MKKIKVIVLMGGRSPEHEVSLVSGKEVVKHLNPEKYEVLPVVISKDGQNWQLKNKEEFLLKSSSDINQAKDLVPTLRRLEPTQINKNADLVFIAMHGPFGEDGTIQGLFETAGFPYTGAGVLASAIGMDKPMFKKIMEREGIPIAKYLIFEKGDKVEKIVKKFNFPLVIKPSNQGSSVGVNLVKDEKDLSIALKTAFIFGNTIIVEEYIKGVEVTCGVLGNKDLIALPVVEIIPKKEFFDYEAKYTDGMSAEIVPAGISPKLTRAVQETAKKVFKSIGCRGFGRIDMIIRNQKLFVLEINTIPGLTPASLLPKAAAAGGISYPQLLDKIIKLSLEN